MALLNPTGRLGVCLRRGVAALCLLMGALHVPAQPGGSDYQIKTIFLFNFASFVEWPATAFADPHAPLIIGVLGHDPFGSFLDETVRGEKASGRNLVIRRYRLVEEIDACHILFVSGSESGRLKAIFAALRGRSILTVGDTEGFALQGGIVQFFTDRNRVRLRINLDAAKAAGLVISSKLLRTVEVIEPGKK